MKQNKCFHHYEKDKIQNHEIFHSHNQEDENNLCHHHHGYNNRQNNNYKKLHYHNWTDDVDHLDRNYVKKKMNHICHDHDDEYKDKKHGSENSNNQEKYKNNKKQE